MKILMTLKVIAATRMLSILEVTLFFVPIDFYNFKTAQNHKCFSFFYLLLTSKWIRIKCALSILVVPQTSTQGLPFWVSDPFR